MRAALTASQGQKIYERYTLLEKLGTGGQGEVWRARDEARGEDVALKLLSPELARSEQAWRSLQREHEITSRLQHGGFLRVEPPQRFGEIVVLPMELAAGGDLSRLRGAGYLDIVPVLIEIAQALEHAHEHGIVHRDLKPGNVLFDSRGRVRLADFGAATALNETPSAQRPSFSPFSASPEQLRGEPPRVSDDIYGLGALAYELLSNYPPYYPRFDIKRVLEELVPEIKPVQPAPPQLCALVMRMLARVPAQRPQTMREVIDVLDATLNDTIAFEFENIPPPAQNAPAATPPASAAVAPPPQSFNVHGAPAAPSRPAAIAVSPWDDLKIDMEIKPRLMRLEPERARRAPWVMLVLLAAVAFCAFYWLPRYMTPDIVSKLPGFELPTQQAQKTPAAATNAPDAAALAAASAKAAEAKAAAESRLSQTRAQFKQRLAALEARAAGVWGGADFATAKTRAAESVGAHDAGNLQLAQTRLDDALHLLGNVESRSPRALAAQIAAADRALAAGQQEVARQAFQLAQRIDPGSPLVTNGLRRVSNLGSVLPLIADGQNAEAAKDFARAAQDYSQALSLDPNNAEARAGLARAHAAFGEDSYAKAVGAGFAALGAGRLDEARLAFEKAHSVRPNGKEAANGLARVGAALSARGYAASRQRAAALESEERWDEALKEYEGVLKLDPSLAFAQAGKTRAAARAELGRGLQDLIDHPERLAAEGVRAEAVSLMQRAQSEVNTGPVLRSQVTRLQILLPEFDKPVRLALVSDNATQVTIQRVGAFGSFSRREIELKPGKYTVVGTRAGYRDVRRDVTIAPGNNEVQTINVSCVEPI